MEKSIHVFYDFFTADECQYFSKYAQKHYEYACSIGRDPNSFEQTRAFYLLGSPMGDKLISRAREYLEPRLNVKLEAQGVELQVWHKGSESIMHIHEDNDRACSDYNSLIYLNDDYEDGEFYTDSGFTMKPKAGSLTFFNGQVIPHGVKVVNKCHRYTIIFWWKNTKFLYDNELKECNDGTTEEATET